MAALGAASASAQDLADSISIAVRNSPLLKEANFARLASLKELDQARGLYLPSVDVFGSVGPRYQDLDDNDSSDSGAAGRGELRISQLVYDWGRTKSEVDRQQARSESAETRLVDRSESLALNVIQQYLELLRALEAEQFALDEFDSIQRVYVAVQGQVDAFVASFTDLDQVQERLIRAERSAIQFRQAAVDARNNLLELVGQEIVNPTLGEEPSFDFPYGLEEAIATALDDNPGILTVQADIRAAEALRLGSDAEFFPTVTLEGSVSRDENNGLDDSDETAAELLIVARWNVFRGGIDTADAQEQRLRVQEQRERLANVRREVERLVRSAWDQRRFDLDRIDNVSRQIEVSRTVSVSYEAQFLIGEKTLLDVLDSLNILFNSRVEERTLYYSSLFAGFRILAAQNKLLAYFNVDPPKVDEPTEALPTQSARFSAEPLRRRGDVNRD
ncbi:MAG: TolC family protein [Alphaproteobacteria bacterium]|nr:TolC family protein [Alphaproteobacteria bacterium]